MENVNNASGADPFAMGDGADPVIALVVEQKALRQAWLNLDENNPNNAEIENRLDKVEDQLQETATPTTNLGSIALLDFVKQAIERGLDADAMISRIQAHLSH